MATTYVRSYAKENQVNLFRNMYGWMSMALLISAFAALAMSRLIETSVAMQQFLLQGSGMMVLIVVEIVAVLAFTFGLRKFSFGTLTGLFILYSVLNGVTLFPLLMLYTQESVISTFLITAGAFGTMAVYGSITRRDLSSLGSICFMALIGLIIATIVNIFVQSSTMGYIVSYAGVLIFSGLTLFDSWKYKKLISAYDGELTDEVRKIALMGSFELYLDFVNMFIYLLRILGNRK